MAEWCSKKVCKVLLVLPIIGVFYLVFWYMTDSTTHSVPAQEQEYDFHLVLKNTSFSTRYPITTHGNPTLPTHVIHDNLSATPLSLCHEQDNPSTSHDSNSDNNVLIIGASSFIGGSIARLLHESQVSVTATEDTVNIGFDPMAWYRWEQLIGMGMSPQYVDYGKTDTIKSLLKKHSPKTIVYIPTVVFSDKQFSKEFVEKVTKSNENFLHILKAANDVSTSTNIILVSIRDPKSSYSSLIKLFDLSLSVYNRLYGTSMAIIRTEGVYGPWQSGTNLGKVFINDLVRSIDKKLLSSGDRYCSVVNDVSEFIENVSPVNTSHSIMNAWIREYEELLQNRNKGVIASTYMTTRRNAQYAITFNNNNYYFMENWFKNIYKMNLNITVFHDDLSSDFMSTFKANYPNTDFVRVTDYKNLSPNDRRFGVYYDYILKHPEISYFVMTDMRDVIIQNDPFEVLEVLGDYFYVGIDEPFKHVPKLSYLPKLFARCFNRGRLDYQEELEELGFFNAGVIGGNRYVILAFLTKFQQYLDMSSKQNCNMAVVEYIAHKDFYEHLVYGWPFNAGFLTHQPQIPGLAVLHKWSMSSHN